MPHPIYSPHLTLAHNYWKEIVQSGDSVIDATCGNGHDTLFLSQIVLATSLQGYVMGIDIQKSALDNTQALLKKNLTPMQYDRVHLYQQSHTSFPEETYRQTIKLIVYNLGYLPGQNKQITTQTSTTLTSVENALHLLTPGGAISITCYPGHAEGLKEETALLVWLQTLSYSTYSICHHRWINRTLSPSLILIKKYLTI